MPLWAKLAPGYATLRNLALEAFRPDGRLLEAGETFRFREGQGVSTIVFSGGAADLWEVFDAGPVYEAEEMIMEEVEEDADGNLLNYKSTLLHHYVKFLFAPGVQLHGPLRVA